jgi:ABC-2 type transport system permease protein/oleandomycin transport system permease protein
MIPSPSPACSSASCRCPWCWSASPSDFRIHTSVGTFLLGLGFVLLFGYAMSWIFAAVGLMVKDPETAQAAAFPVLAPLVFASSAFVLVERMPGWLQAFARNQPVSVTVEAVRALSIGGPTSHAVLQALLWCGAVVLVFAPIAVRLYRRAL